MYSEYYLYNVFTEDDYKKIYEMPQFYVSTMEDYISMKSARDKIDISEKRFNKFIKLTFSCGIFFNTNSMLYEHYNLIKFPLQYEAETSKIEENSTEEPQKIVLKFNHIKEIMKTEEYLKLIRELFKKFPNIITKCSLFDGIIIVDKYQYEYFYNNGQLIQPFNFGRVELTRNFTDELRDRIASGEYNLDIQFQFVFVKYLNDDNITETFNCIRTLYDDYHIDKFMLILETNANTEPLSKLNDLLDINYSHGITINVLFDNIMNDYLNDVSTKISIWSSIDNQTRDFIYWNKLVKHIGDLIKEDYLRVIKYLKPFNFKTKEEYFYFTTGSISKLSGSKLPNEPEQWYSSVWTSWEDFLSV